MGDRRWEALGPLENAENARMNPPWFETPGGVLCAPCVLLRLLFFTALGLGRVRRALGWRWDGPAQDSRSLSLRSCEVC